MREEAGLRYPEKTIDELAEHVGSGATPRGGSDVYLSNGVLFVRSQNVRLEGLDLRDVAFIDLRTHASMKRSEVFANDVLLNITGASIGRCCVLPAGLGSVNVNQHVCAIRLPNATQSDAAFLNSVLASHIGQRQIDRLNAGGNREGLNYQQLREFVVPWPASNVRRVIAEILDMVDEAIRKTEQIIAKLGQVKQGLLHDLLTRGIDDNGQLRDPDRHPEQFKDSELGRIPGTWQTRCLESIIRIVDCKHLTPDYVEQGVPVVRPRNIKVDGLDWSDISYVTNEDYRMLTDVHAPKRGDIVFSRNASFGVPCYVDTDRPFAIGQDVVVMTHSEADTLFLFLALQSAVVRSQIERNSGGSTFGRINLAAIRNLVLPIPCKREQVLIAERMRSVNARRALEGSQRDKLLLLKTGLMDDLLTGRVGVTELTQDTAG